jgi:hypothetical protein
MDMKALHGPRYDPVLTVEQRCSVANGIWLCQNCAKLIDNDPKKGPKYAFYDDLVPLAQAGKTIIIYQHAARNGSFSDQIRGRLTALQAKLGLPAEDLLALRWRRISPRAFIFVLASGRKDITQKRLQDFLAGPWGAHFELVPARNAVADDQTMRLSLPSLRQPSDT